MNDFRPRPIAWLVLAISVALSFAIFSWRLVEDEREQAERFQALVDVAQGGIQDRINSYEDILTGMAALNEASERVTRAEFHRYFRRLDLTTRYPGFRTFHYVERVMHDSKGAFEQSVRADTALLPQGYPAFAIYPQNMRQEYLVVKYVEPWAGNEALLGYDVGSDPARRATIDRACDSGLLVASGASVLAGDTADLVGFQLRVPIYVRGGRMDTVAQRREAFTGAVSAGIRMRDLMKGVFSRQELDHFYIQIHDGGLTQKGLADAPPGGENPPQLMFESEAWAAEGAGTVQGRRFQGLREVQVGGRTWRLEFQSMPAFEARSKPLLAGVLLVSGLIASALLFALVHMLLTSGATAQRLARQMTRDLRASEQKLVDAQRLAKLGSWSYDPVGERWTLSTDLMYWAGANQSVGSIRPDFSIIHPRDRDAFEHRFLRAVSMGKGFEREFRIQVPGESVRWVHFIARAHRLESQDGKPEHHLSGTMMDISQRKQSEVLRALAHTVTRVMAERDNATDAMREVLEAWCLSLDWDFGARWAWDEVTGKLHCVETWGGGTDNFRAFDAHVRELTLEASSEGLTRRAFVSREPVSMDNVTTEPSFQRAPLAAMAGLRGAFAFPIFFGSTTLGVLEFYSREARKPDAEMINMARQMGAQIGQDLQRRKAERHLRHLAGHDELTGLVNRAQFVTSLEHALARATRSDDALAVLFIDLDRFKPINDTLGHDAGDDLLRQVAQRFRDSLRRTDTIARHGGDEFVVLLDETTSIEMVTGVVRKLVTILGQPYRVLGHDCHVTASIGVAIYPGDGDEPATLLKHADFAMYRAKEAGSNTFAFYAPQMNATSLSRMKLDTDLRRAIERNELTLEYQPKLSLLTGRVTGVEALARWRHPEFGLIPPAQFIALAEEIGLISEIGSWVLRQALQDALSWRQRFDHLPVAVNLSVRQFNHGDLANEITSALTQSGMPAELLELEVTESMLIRDPSQAARLLARIRALGVKLSIDDFGTGFSSLSYLKRLPLDAIKLDRSFVLDLPDDVGAAAIATGVIALAHQLNLEVIAEGVETAAQAAFLSNAGCDQAQGFYYSRPLSSEALVDWLQSYENDDPTVAPPPSPIPGEAHA